MTTADFARRTSLYRHLPLALALLVPAVLLGFAKSYFRGLTFSGMSVTTLVHVHAALMGLWILMLAGQAWFIHTERYRVHRWVGRSSFAIVPLIVVSTILLSHETLNRKSDITTLDARFEIYDLLQVVGFAACWALALVHRKRTPIHVRYIVSTAFAFGSAVVFRILMNWFQWLPGMNVADDVANFDNLAAANGAVLVLALLGLIAMDWRRGIKRSPFWLVTGTTLLIHVGFFTFAKTDWWMALVQWFARLPL